MSQSPLFAPNESVFDNLLSMERRAEAAEAHRDALLAALKAMVASYDGLRDALTCPTVIAKLAAADAAIRNAERV